ncbi:Kinase A inhibitor [bioreactor metagenome]|uniref:Kinase A inhibitor n=1 Tax=bioreactor metagenome TaxID=1076179 RepID=A0A645IYX9_9ZZZZ
MVFDSETGPDLADVAAEQGCTIEELIAELCRHELRIELLAAAMAPMMSGVRLGSEVSRQSQPRTDVQPGSIMVAGANAIIQPFPGPTGWKVVGRTPLTIVDMGVATPIGFAIGDRVRLRTVDPDYAGTLAGLRMGDWPETQR